MARGPRIAGEGLSSPELDLARGEARRPVGKKRQGLGGWGTVAEGEAVIVMEAMKMEHTLTAAYSGVVSINVSVGDMVSTGDVLAEVDPDTDTNTDAAADEDAD